MQDRPISGNTSSFFDVHHTLLTIGETQDPHYLPFFKERKYSVILRKACAELNLTIIEALLKFKNEIDLDVNGLSSRHNQTALDYALTAYLTNSPNFDKIVLLLASAGALTRSMLQGEHAITLDDEDDNDMGWRMPCALL